MKTFQQLYEDLLRQKFRWRSRCRRNMIQSIWIVFCIRKNTPLLFRRIHAQIVSREHARKAAYLMRLRQEKKESFLSIRHVVRGAQLHRRM